MKIRVLWVGKTRNKHYLALQEDYLQRLSHFAKTEIIEVKDGGGKEAEGQRIVQHLNPTSTVCLLDVEGRSLSSHELSGEIERWQIAGRKETTFIIGGADGVSPQVAKMATDRISLSFLTFTHEMARVILLEQLYRAHTIIKGFPYQK
ncbi:MAG: 23S rRNA (pseudouridine(1915)-N(3))-methyltransferase RlmH [Blastocatellia bacterium]|nr:23S rRNA (pseudouridine(1915)-N(3))-methyltransferase RlmH [Blastocatellia bacterium]